MFIYVVFASRGAGEGPPHRSARVESGAARAREIARIAPTVAYYCRMRAVETGMRMRPRPDDALRAVLDVLEVRAGDEG